MGYLSKNWLNGGRVGSNEVSQLCELGVAEESSQLTYSHFACPKACWFLGACSWRWQIAQISGDSVTEVLDCSLCVVKGCSESCSALLSGESHVDKLGDLGLVGLVLGCLFFLILFILFFLFLLFLLLFLFGGFGL